jgi:hypothetical protein
MIDLKKKLLELYEKCMKTVNAISNVISTLSLNIYHKKFVSNTT